LRDLRAAGWYCGNTHTHYHLQIDEDPDERLRTVPPAEALDVSAISYLIRGDSPYITNRYPIGRLPQFSRNGTLIDMGQECRNNLVSDGIGYGHGIHGSVLDSALRRAGATRSEALFSRRSWNEERAGASHGLA
jgi:hypothetical protein